MGGDIAIQSEMGKGSQFIVEILLDYVQGTQAETKNNLPEIKTEQNNIIKKNRTTSQNKFLERPEIRILLAEDNKINQKVISLIIESLGYQCNVASNGQKVLSLIKQNNYDLILMDYHMPILDGIETTQEIRKHNKEIIIIALTASTFEKDIKNCLSAGMNDYLSKPINKEELDIKIKRYVNC